MYCRPLGSVASATAAIAILISWITASFRGSAAWAGAAIASARIAGRPRRAAIRAVRWAAGEIANGRVDMIIGVLPAMPLARGLEGFDAGLHRIELCLQPREGLRSRVEIA